MSLCRAKNIDEVIEFSKIDGNVIPTKITSPVFYDPNGEKQNV